MNTSPPPVYCQRPKNAAPTLLRNIRTAPRLSNRTMFLRIAVSLEWRTIMRAVFENPVIANLVSSVVLGKRARPSHAGSCSRAKCLDPQDVRMFWRSPSRDRLT
jgi:hypothetical protein